MALDFNKHAEKGNAFIKELAKELGYPQDVARTGRVLRSVLHALRDQLTIEESLGLLAQLPMFLKAVYVEGWKIPEKKKRIKHLDEFFNEIRKNDKLTASHDFHTDDEVDNAVSVVFLLLRQYVSLGELEDIKAVLPKELKPIVQSVLMI